MRHVLERANVHCEKLREPMCIVQADLQRQAQSSFVHCEDEGLHTLQCAVSICEIKDCILQRSVAEHL